MIALKSKLHLFKKVMCFVFRPRLRLLVSGLAPGSATAPESTWQRSAPCILQVSVGYPRLELGDRHVIPSLLPAQAIDVFNGRRAAKRATPMKLKPVCVSNNFDSALP